MKLFYRGIVSFLLLLSIQTTKLTAQHLTGFIPTNTATHTATQNGSWFDPTTWNTGTVPSDGAIVVIPANITVTYEGNSTAHIFAIRVDGTFNCIQSNSSQTSQLIFDTFIGMNTSVVTFRAGNPTDGAIAVEIRPFDIEAHKSGTSGFAQVWNANAISYYSDGEPTYEVTYNVGPDDRFNSYADALLGNTSVTEISRNLINDGAGVLGRYLWDPEQLSLGLVVMGELEIVGQEKTNMIKLGADALRNQALIELASTPVGWNIGDSLVVTRGGNQSTLANGEDLVAIQAINGTTITCTNNLTKNHEGRVQDNLHCYVGNLSRNIQFKSTVSTIIHQRGHLMAMHNPTNIQIKNAAFVDMGRTDKSKLLNDFLWANWVQPKVFKSKISALGQECSELRKAPVADITNIRGRYSIHLHRTGANLGANMVHVTGNVVWGNPGWGITHHDSHATVSDNVVYDVTGSGIVSESGSETGFWDNNLVVDVKDGHSTSPYHAALFYDDYLFSGQGLGMKGRAVVCRGNVIANVKQGVGVMNMNPVVNHLDRVDAKALASVRPNYLFDQFPLCSGGYSKEGDGVMPVEVALILENTTVISSNQGLRSIERDMGVNHESRSVFDGFIAWGVNQGLSITYQADYSFKDVFISGKNASSIGMYLWKHSHNHVFENIKLVDLGYGVTVSKLVESGNGALKTRNNGFTPWYFVDLVLENVGVFYQLEKENPATTTVYDEHSDNPIHLSSSEITSRPTTFTILDSSGLVVDYNTGDFRFEIDGVITDDLGSYDMGIKQAWAQGNLRLDYPTRIYEFASQQKFEDYLSINGVYKDTADNDQLYFIINEILPNRRTYDYTSFPVRVKIMNAPSSLLSMALIESPANFLPTNRLISRLATVTQSSTNIGLTYNGTSINAGATKAVDGNNNGRINAQIFQRGLVPVGSFSETLVEQEPWYDLDLGEIKQIDFIDIWNTVELNGANIETLSPHFQNFYVLISDSAFTSTTTLASARALADYEYFNGNGVARKFSLDHLNAQGRYVRIQAVGLNKIAHAEVEIIGRKLPPPSAILPIEWMTFEANRIDRERVDLGWVTSSEFHNQGFDIERMLAHETMFTKIGWVEASGTSTTPTRYHFEDKNAYQGISYYRLKQIDFDGATTYSEIRAVSGIGTLGIGFGLYPNPVQEAFFIDLGEKSKGAKKATVSIFDGRGQLVYQRNHSITTQELLKITLVEDIPAAVYWLSLKLDNGEVFKTRFIKQ
ncbi:T9SS type A sorting domain-containing protein [Aureispira sp. CCB-E]|uniref:T9SS type A sorting domain-containing protein n=1 Tax=Aureispira sp. CCB-E TaxID=3051121 RepID=UPI002868D27E|nr:T9SS type A sorting domain-containing protein [Aureispira sp. CCB-E]WMX13716.1 T9SS type A sorting domain-containing protein [Aureispira sp. CCB-E]